MGPNITKGLENMTPGREGDVQSKTSSHGKPTQKERTSGEGPDNGSLTKESRKKTRGPLSEYKKRKGGEGGGRKKRRNVKKNHQARNA